MSNKKALTQIIFLSLILLSLFNSYLCLLEQKENQFIELNAFMENRGHFLDYNITFQNLFINGSISEKAKYLLITAKDSNSYSYFFISKYKIFTEVDYSLIQDFSLYGNKLVLPTSYFNLSDENGFYLNIVCPNVCTNLSLNFQSINELSLEIGEKFSFFSKNENTKNFLIKVKKAKNENLKNGDSIGVLITGGDQEQISWSVNSILKEHIKFLENSYGEILLNKDDESEILIRVNISENVKFTIQTEIINEYTNESFVHDKNIYDNDYEQFFFVKNGRKECFNIKKNYIGNYKYQKELMILGRKSFELEIDDTKNYTFNSKNINNVEYNYITSGNIVIKNNVEKICIISHNEEISLFQINIYNRFIDNIQSGDHFYEKQQESLLTGITYGFILTPKKNYDSSTKNEKDRINIHTHSQYFNNNKDYSNLIGLTAEIKVISGNLTVYKNICIDFPYCRYFEKSELEELAEIQEINGYFITDFPAQNDTFSFSNKQNLIVIYCENKNSDECKYEITYYNMQQTRKIYNNTFLTKYIGKYEEIDSYKKENLYSIELSNFNNRIVINLAVKFGDAYIIQKNNFFGCKNEEKNLGTDTKLIYSCDENLIENFESKKFIFSVRANNKKNTIYSLYINEIEKDSQEQMLPIGMGMFNIISEKKDEFVHLFYANDKNYNNGLHYYSLFNLINCNVEVFNSLDKIHKYSNFYYLFIQDTNELIKHEVSYNLMEKNLKENKYVNKNECLYYLASFINEDLCTDLTITESKPLKFSMSKTMNIKQIRFVYFSPTNVENIYIDININGNVPIKFRIKNDLYIIYSNKLINLSNYIPNKEFEEINKINFSIELDDSNDNLNNDENIIIDLNIISKDTITPYFIKENQQLTDVITGINQTRYYITLINQNSFGEFNFNSNNHNEKIYARLINRNYIKDIGGWNNRFVLPEDDVDKYKLLTYDYEKQKLIIKKEYTKDCDNFCYLLLGVITGNNVPFIYNFYLKLTDGLSDKESYILLKNSQLLSGYISGNNNNYFRYKLNDINGGSLYFKCEKCKLSLSFDDDIYSSDSIYSKNYLSFGDNKYIDILKDDIQQKNNTNTFINILISSDNKDENDNEYKYSLQFNPFDNNNISLVSQNIPMSYDSTKKNKTSEFYVLKLDNYDNKSNIIAITVPINQTINSKNNITIYGNIISPSDYYNNLNEVIPTIEKHDFPPKNEISKEYLKITPENLKNYLNITDKYLFLNIYNNDNIPYEIYTSLNDFNSGDTLSQNEYQLINLDSKDIFTINTNNEIGINYNALLLNGQVKILNKDNKSFVEMNNKYETLNINSKNINDNSFKIQNINNNNEDLFLLLKYKPNKIDNSIDDYNNEIENLVIGGSSTFIKSNISDNFDLKYLIPIDNIETDLPINMNINLLIPDKNLNSINTDKNILTMESYLISEDDLIPLKYGNLSFLTNRPKYLGNYYISHHQAFLNINEKNIQAFSKEVNNKKIYAFVNVTKTKNNDLNYKLIKGYIYTNPPNNKNIYVPIIDNNYYFGSFSIKNSSLTHIYKLGSDSGKYDNNIKMKIEFSSTIKNIIIKIVNDWNLKEENESYFGLVKNYDNNFGKKVIIVEKNLNNVYLLIELPDDIKNNSFIKDVDYIYKYNYIQNNVDIKSYYTYNNKLSFTKINLYNLKTNITINKIKDSNGNIVLCDYYIRTYKTGYLINSNKNLGINSNLNNSIIYNNNTNIIYKITSNNDTEDLLIEISLDNDNYSVDVIAETKNNKELFSYEKTDLTFEVGKIPKKDNKLSWKMLLIAVLLLLLLIMLAVCICCSLVNRKSRKQKRMRQKSLRQESLFDYEHVLIDLDGSDSDDNDDYD